jgi:hypothetical protein
MKREDRAMLTKLRMLAYVLLLLAGTHLCSQGPPRTPEQILTQAGISLDKDSLIRALNDNRAAVLSSVATILAEKRITEAGPAIASRMRGEQNKQLVL